MEQLKPEEAVEMLRKEGINVSIEEAKAILEFLRKLANITVANYLENIGYEDS